MNRLMERLETGVAGLLWVAATILLPTVMFPVPVTNQFFKDLTTYIQNPSQLDSLLADMDRVAKSSR